MISWVQRTIRANTMSGQVPLKLDLNAFKSIEYVSGFNENLR